MNFIGDKGQERITHFDLSTALRIEAKSVKYHVNRRLEALQAFGEVVRKKVDGRDTFLLNKKQALLLMTFVSNNSEAKIYIINRIIDSEHVKSNHALVETCKDIVKDLGSKLEGIVVAEVTSNNEEFIYVDQLDEVGSIVDSVDNTLPADAKNFMKKVKQNI